MLKLFKKNTKLLSIVICNGNKKWPSKTIQSISKEIDTYNSEIIVCSGYSVRSKKNVRTISLKTNIANKLRNFGAINARGKYILFLDNDVVLEPGWSSTIYKAIEKNVQAGFGTVLYGNEYTIRTINENGLLLRKNIFTSFPFDEGIGPGTVFSSSEALDLKLRLKKSKIHYIHLPYRVLHPSLRSFNTTKKVLIYSLGNGFIYSRYNLFFHFIWALFRSILRSIFGSKNFSRRALLVRFFALIAGFLTNEEN